MLFCERRPHGSLAGVVHALWYICRPRAESRCERVLPTGRAQIVINLAHDRCTGWTPDGISSFAQAATLAVGLHTHAMLIDTRDTEEMIGAVFAPTGLARVSRNAAHSFSGQEIDLTAVLGPAVSALRDRLREEPTPARKLATLETFLIARLGPGRDVHPAVSLALDLLHTAPHARSIASLSRSTGLSDRRLRDLFREEVGVPPKLYARILRFGRAVAQIHRGEDLAWAELALDCGYCDQSHFANDFHAFSGISPTTYTRARRPWANHIAL